MALDDKRYFKTVGIALDTFKIKRFRAVLAEKRLSSETQKGSDAGYRTASGQRCSHRQDRRAKEMPHSVAEERLAKLKALTEENNDE